MCSSDLFPHPRLVRHRRRCYLEWSGRGSAASPVRRGPGLGIVRPLAVLLEEPHWALGRWGGGLGFGAGGEGAVLATSGDEDGSHARMDKKKDRRVGWVAARWGRIGEVDPAWTDAAGCGDAPFHVRVDANLPQIWVRNGSGQMRDG